MSKPTGSAHKKQLAKVERQIENLVDLVADTGKRSLIAKLDDLETERDSLQAKLDRSSTPNQINVAAKLKQLRDLVRSLSTADLDEQDRAEVRTLLSDWFGTIPVDGNGDAELSLSIPQSLPVAGARFVR